MRKEVNLMDNNKVRITDYSLKYRIDFGDDEIDNEHEYQGENQEGLRNHI